MNDALRRGWLDAGEEGEENDRLRREVEEDIADSRDLSMQERSERLRGVMNSAWTILRARPDFERAIAWQDPRPADFDEIWQRLMARYRARRTHKSHPRSNT